MSQHYSRSSNLLCRYCVDLVYVLCAHEAVFASGQHINTGPCLPRSCHPPPLTALFILPPSSWYFGGTPKIEAEKCLMFPNNISGTFLIRKSLTQKDSLSLSIKDGDKIKHYRIRKLDDGGFFITSRISFNNLQVWTCHSQKRA